VRPTKPPIPETYAKRAKAQNRSQDISEREQQCINETIIRSNDQIARAKATPDALTELRMRKANDARDRELSECRSEADRENRELSSHERREYELQTQQERHQAALVMILTTSTPR
jgi:hypothetical protein